MEIRKAEGQRLSDSMYEAGLPGTEIKNALVKEGFAGTTAVALLLTSQRKAKDGNMSKKTNSHTGSNQNNGQACSIGNRLHQRPISRNQSSGQRRAGCNTEKKSELSEYLLEQVRIVERGVSIVSRMGREGISGIADLDRLEIFCLHVRNLTETVKLLQPLLERSSGRQNRHEDIYSEY